MFARFSITTRIYLSMSVMIVISFLAIGGFTYIHFKSQNEEYHQNRLKRKEHAVIKSIGYFLEREGIYENPDSIMVAFSDKITALADINNLAINVYNLQGELLISSYTRSFEKGFFVFNLENSILNKLSSGIDRFVMETKADSVNILSAYRYMNNIDNEPMAIINLPYLRETGTSKEEITLFLTRLAEIYALLFLGASILAFLLSRYITKTLKSITKRLQKIDLAAPNEPLQWQSNDEVGLLVSEYNRMLLELEKSAELLAQSERESAWREMAKQVAHEIKNPLTPMKLSVQHLQRSLQVNEDSKEKFQRFAKTMIAQIDELSNIASEFSNFAKLPGPTLNQIDAVEIIKQVVDLFEKTIDCDIDFESTETTALIMGDKGQFARVLTNLIKNAEQAMEAPSEGRIKISLMKDNLQYFLKVEDNGKGMNDDELKKAFIPNFTTKSSGMGLGLPMVKNSVQNMGGSVEIDSRKGRGTVVSIFLPILE